MSIKLKNALYKAPLRMVPTFVTAVIRSAHRKILGFSMGGAY